MRRQWQAGMIALARSPRIKAAMQRSRAGGRLATRYVHGETAAVAARGAAARLAGRGLRSSLFHLGEYVDTEELVAINRDAKLAAAQALGAAGLDVHVSLDPTQVGERQSPELARRNLIAVAEAVAQASNRRPGVHCAMLDMEDRSLTDPTIAHHDALADAGLPTALTLQAYLHRSADDLDRQIRRGARVRLVAGAFAADRSVAFTRRADIKANYRRLLDRMFSAEAREAGFYPIVATHDEALCAHAREAADAGGWPADGFEFEQLLGVRESLSEALCAEGHRVRLYAPFGTDWWPHAARRIGENPRNAGLLLRSVLSR
jgi:proline dehydrogenase